jgi:hypothetical protein
LAGLITFDRQIINFINGWRVQERKTGHWWLVSSGLGGWFHSATTGVEPVCGFWIDGRIESESGREGSAPGVCHGRVYARLHTSVVALGNTVITCRMQKIDYHI